MKAIASPASTNSNIPSLTAIELPVPVTSGHDLLVEVQAIFVNTVDTKVSAGFNAEQQRVLDWDALGVVKYLNGKGLFKLRPDIHLRPRENNQNRAMICDVKWKMVESSKATLDQSQADLYQMLAYGVNYQQGTGDMLLIYPSHEGFSQPLCHPYEFSHQKENPLRLWVVPFVIGKSLQSSGLRLPEEENLI